MPLFFPLVLPVLLQATQPSAPTPTPNPSATAPSSPPPAGAPPVGAASSPSVVPNQTPSGQGTSATGVAEARVVGLDEAVQVALKRQPAILQAQGATRASAGRVDQARSGLLPQVTGTASYNRVHGALRTTTGSGVAAPTSGNYDFWNFGATGTQLIWDFGQTWERTKATDRATDAFRATEKTTELTVALNVRKAFFQARAQKALIRVAEETVVNLDKHLKQIQGFVSVGTRPEIDLAQAKSDLALERVTLVNAQNGYLIAKAQLAVAMGAPGGPSFEVSDEELAPIDVEEQPIEQLAKTATNARPELLSLQRQVEAQEITIRGLKGGYGPTLGAAGNISESGTQLDGLGTAWNVGATLTWQIFQGGLTTGLVREGEGNLDVAHAQLAQEKLQVRLDVETASLGIKAAKQEVSATNDALTNTKERLRLAEGRYEAGVGSIIELGDAQVAASSAAAQVVQAEFDLSVARANLLTAMGRR